MNLARMLVEKQPGLRYRRAQLFMPLLRRAFRHIGSGSVIVAPLRLQGVEHISIGDDVTIREGSWLAAEGERGALTIGDRTHAGHRVHVHSIDPVTIGRNCQIADNTMITTSDHDRIERAKVHGTGPVTIGDDVFIGQNAVILGGVTIGDGATVAAGAVVVADVPAHAVVGGVPAKVLRAGGATT